MKLFGKNPAATLTLGAAMSALVTQDAISAEQAQAANAELAEAGIKGVQLITEAAYKVMEDKASTAEQATATANATLKATTDALTAAGAKDVAELVAQRDTARAEAAKFGAQPGALGTTPDKEKADVAEEGGDENEKLVASLHAKMLGEA